MLFALRFIRAPLDFALLEQRFYYGAHDFWDIGGETHKKDSAHSVGEGIKAIEVVDSILLAHVAKVGTLSAEVVLQKGNHEKRIERVKKLEPEDLENEGMFKGTQSLVVFSFV